MGYNMNNVQSLLIRACKAKDPDKRIRSVYRRFFYGGDMEYRDIAAILSNIIVEYCPIPQPTLLAALHPLNRRYYGCTEETDFYEVCAKVFISHIRLRDMTELKGFRKPSRYNRG